jgi:hypothetical protein
MLRCCGRLLSELRLRMAEPQRSVRLSTSDFLQSVRQWYHFFTHRRKNSTKKSSCFIGRHCRWNWATVSTSALLACYGHSAFLQQIFRRCSQPRLAESWALLAEHMSYRAHQLLHRAETKNRIPRKCSTTPAGPSLSTWARPFYLEKLFEALLYSGE